MFSRKKLERRLESLKTQLEFFEAVERRHLMWTRETQDEEIVQVHFEIADSIRQLRRKYADILERYARADEE